MAEEPSGWRVVAVQERDAVELTKPEPHEVSFKTKQEADEYKEKMKSHGWVASVTPIFVTRATKVRRNKKAQTAPFGDFRKDWKLF